MSKIMVVDDSEAQRFSLKHELEKRGHQIVEATDGSDGLDKLDKNPDVALVICDVNMPKMNGIDMCAKMREQSRFVDTPVFMLTSEVLPELKARAKQYGVRAWIVKPFVTEVLLSAVDKVLKK